MLFHNKFSPILAVVNLIEAHQEEAMKPKVLANH